MMTGEMKIPGPGQEGMLHTRGIMSVQKGVKKEQEAKTDLGLRGKDVEIEFSRL